MQLIDDRNPYILSRVKNFILFLLLIVSAGLIDVYAEAKRCTKAVTAYDPNLPAKVIGTFSEGTLLEITDQTKRSNSMLPVRYQPESGPAIEALCLVDELVQAGIMEAQAAEVKTENKATDPNAAKALPEKPKSKMDLKSTGTASEKGWFTDYIKAFEKASAEKKLMLLNFTGSDWCGWCIKLDEEIFSKGAFKNYAEKNLVLVKLDFPAEKVPALVKLDSPKGKTLPQRLRQQNEYLADHYGIQGYPTVIVLDPEENKIGKLGYTPGGPSAFIKKIENLKKN